MRYEFLSDSEREKISDITKRLAREGEGDFPPYDERYKRVKSAVGEYFKDNTTIVPKGFVNFRMRDMYYNVEAMVDTGYEMYLKEREYEEFTYLLSVFIEEKDSREDVLHLVWDNGEVKLLNKRKRDVTQKYEREFFEEAKLRGITNEDLAISAVISAAPKKLILHRPPEQSPLKEALLKIFGKKAQVCYGCNICENS